MKCLSSKFVFIAFHICPEDLLLLQESQHCFCYIIMILVYWYFSCFSQGSDSNPGINPRALQELFAVTEDRNKEWDYSITVSVMEIYNENIRDLLSDSPTEAKEVKQSRNPADGHYVPGLTWIRVQTVDDVNEVNVHGAAV